MEERWENGSEAGVAPCLFNSREYLRTSQIKDVLALRSGDSQLQAIVYESEPDPWKWMRDWSRDPIMSVTE